MHSAVHEDLFLPAFLIHFPLYFALRLLGDPMEDQEVIQHLTYPSSNLTSLQASLHSDVSFATQHSPHIVWSKVLIRLLFLPHNFCTTPPVHLPPLRYSIRQRRCDEKRL